MRNVMYAMNITLDGCYDHTLATPDEELMEYFANIMKDVGVMVYGRKMFELMFPYWSDVARDQSGTKQENEFAEAITSTEKIVFSNTLKSADFNASITSGDIANEILKLKKQPGKRISIAGMGFRSQLTALGLIDEIYLVIHPVIAGKGKKLMDDTELPQKLNLTLVDTKIFKSGAVGLHYMKR